MLERPSFLGAVFWTDLDEDGLENPFCCEHPHLYLFFHPSKQLSHIGILGEMILDTFRSIPQPKPKRIFALWSGNPLDKIAFWEALR